MKEGIHPAMHEITITCACGHQIKTLSTLSKNFAIEICSHCHPYFTGKQKLIDTAGRVERFQKKYAKFQEAKKKKKTKH
ncbi:MAG: 50S ribosomal protein L31 [Deltaproteobacteria bacterium]|nr:50S ribosomal protein L31 [Deltaproteobacteria bacterium]